jgi:hypothetical protein
MVLSSGRLPLALFLSSKALLFSSPFLSKYVVRLALLFGPLAPTWLPRLLSHLSGSRTVPWPLILRLVASTEHQLYRISLPRLIISRTIDLSGLDQGDPLGLLQDVP